MASNLDKEIVSLLSKGSFDTICVLHLKLIVFSSNELLQEDSANASCSGWF